MYGARKSLEKYVDNFEKGEYTLFSHQNLVQNLLPLTYIFSSLSLEIVASLYWTLPKYI